MRLTQSFTIGIHLEKSRIRQYFPFDKAYKISASLLPNFFYSSNIKDTEDLKQELRTSLKSGRKHNYDSDLLTIYLGSIAR